MTSLQTEPAEHAHDRQDLPIEFRVSRNGTPRRRLTLVGRQYTLGNGPDCSVRLDDPTLLPIHATIERREHGLLLRAMARPISVNGSSCTQHVLQFGDHFCLGNYDFELVPSAEPPQSKDVPKKQLEEPDKQSTTPRRRVSFAQSLDILQQSTSTAKAVDSLVHLMAEDSSSVPSARESQRAILANEKRWQERWLRQQEKHRESQQRSKEQLESLRAAQSNAEIRARQSEEIAQALKQQLSELSNKWTTVTDSTVPDLQQQLEKHQRESLASQAENQQLVDSIRSRMDSIQSAIDEVQAETQAIRQHSVFNEEQVRELSEETDQLEQSLDALARTQKSFEGETKATTSRLQEELQDASTRLLDIATELNENRTQRDALRSAIESLQTTLEQVQLDAQQSEHIQDSLATLEAQIESSESRFTELLSYFDSQNLHFQEECESLRQRLELAEQLAGEASRVATELLSRSESAAPFTAPAATEQSRLHSESPHIPYSDVEYLYDATASESRTHQSPEDERAPRERSENIEPTSEPSLPASDADQDVNFRSISPVDDSQSLGFGDSRHLLGSASDSSDSFGPTEKEPISTNQVHESPGASQTHFQPPASQSHAGLLNHDFTAEQSMEQSMEQSDDEIHGFAATMPLTPGLAERISDNSQIPFDQIPIDPESLANGSEFLQPTDDHSSIDNDSSRLVSNSSWPIAPVDSEEVYGSTDFTSHANEHTAHDAIAEEYSEDSLYSDVTSSSQISYSGFAKLDSGIQEDSEEVDSEDSDIVLRDDGIDDKPRYSPPKTRSAAEILAAMGIAVDDDEATSHPENSSNAQPSNAMLESTTPNLADNIGASQDTNEDSSSDASVDDEESIEDYMNRLLNRVQGTPLPQQKPSRASQQASATQSIPADRQRTPASIDEIHESVEKVSKFVQGPDAERANSELADTPPHPLDQTSEQKTPRRAAPEKTTNFAALRELANTNARQAIASSARRRLAKEALFKLSIFGVGMIASLATLAGSQFSLDHWMVVSVCCFLLSLFFLWEALNLRKRLLTSHPVPEELKEPTANDSETE